MNTKINDSLPALLLKPAGMHPDIIHYDEYIPELQATLSFRSLDIQTDLDLIYDWVNQAYARRFWQLNGSKDLVRNTYEAILQNERAHSFIGCIDTLPVCQIDVYGVAGEELEQHVETGEHDCGLHLLMLPTKQLQKGWSYYVLKCFQHFYFSFDQHSCLYAEPDQENTLANKLAMDAGFHFLKTIQLSNKTANLYSIFRDQFQGR